MERKTEFWVIGIFAAIIIAVTIFAAVFSVGIPSAASNFKATQTMPITASDHVRGATDAKVSVIEYGDFQCPACGQYEPIVERLMQEYGSRVEFVFRNFPLYQIHQNAMISSQAAEAAGLQGKYWEMHNLLYQKQSEWSESDNGSVVTKYFDGYAQSLGLDVAKFNADIGSDAVKNRVQADIALADQAKVDHTPTFFINLTQIQNPAGYDQFKAAIDAALASSTAR